MSDKETTETTFKPRLSYRQQEVLSSFKRYPEQKMSPKNSTACALQKRGLLYWDAIPDRLLTVSWKLTDAGKASLS